MNLLSPPNVAVNGHAGDDGLDNLLRAFFQAELPAPWPDAPVPPTAPGRPALLTLRTPSPSVQVPPRVRLLTRSRLALAASVALMLGGAWILSGSSTPHPEAPIPSFQTGGVSADLNFRRLATVSPPAAVTPAQPSYIDEEHVVTPDGPVIIRVVQPQVRDRD